MRRRLSGFFAIPFCDELGGTCAGSPASSRARSPERWGWGWAILGLAALVVTFTEKDAEHLDKLASLSEVHEEDSAAS